MKKLGLTSLGAIVLALVYYFTIGSTQLMAEMQGKVDAQVASLKSDGFAVAESNLSQGSRHYELSLDNPQKVSEFLATQGIEITPSEIKDFEGFRLGIDVHYLVNTTTALSFDIYPIALPIIYRAMMQSKEDKVILDQIDKILSKKAFLVHLDVNALLHSFSGYMKDIDEVIKTDKMLYVKMKGLEFNGQIKDKKITMVNEIFKEINITVADEFTFIAKNSKSNYSRSDKENYKILYSLEKFIVELEKAKIEIDTLSIAAQSISENNLSGFDIKMATKKIRLLKKTDEIVLHEAKFDMGADNFDLSTLEKLENINPNDEKEVLDALQNLISHGIKLDIANFSIKTLELQKRKMDGFSLKSYFEIDKSLDLAMLEKNPMSGISAMNANLNINFSSDIFGLLAQHPQAMMPMMLFIPKDINGTKVYDIELKNSKLMVNGVPMM